MAIKIIMLVVFFGIMIGVGVYCRKHTRDVNGFVLGGRNVGPWLSAFAYGTSYFSAVVFVGYAGQFGWKFGISSTWIGIANALIGALLAWVVLGRRTRVMSHHLHTKTMADFFGERYGSKAIKIAAAAIIFLFLIPYTASVYSGLSKLFEMAFGIPYIWCIVGMAVLTGVYVILGGYMATAINDLIQGLIMVACIIAVVAAVLMSQGGFTQAITDLSNVANDTAAAGQAGVFTSFFGPDLLGLLSVIVLTSLGAWGAPQMISKFYAIKDEKSVKTGTIVSTIFAIIIAGSCYFLGGFSRLFDAPAIYSASGAVMYDAIVPSMLSKLPDILIGVVVVLVLSASMSTLSSLVLTSSSTLTLDLIRGNIVKKMSDKSQLLVMRIFIVFFIALSVVIAIDPPMFIAQLMGISWGAMGGAFIGPYLYGLYWKRATKASVWVSFAVGVGLTVANMIWSFMDSAIMAGAAAMLLSFIITPVVSLITKKPDAAHVARVFACYDDTVTTSAKVALPEMEDK